MTKAAKGKPRVKVRSGIYRRVTKFKLMITLVHIALSPKPLTTTALSSRRLLSSVL